MTFGERLKQLRERAGLSQAALAAQVGISTRQISRLETNAQIPTWPTVQAIAKVLGVSCEVFQDEENEGGA